jgi:hypothetical protein
MTTPARVTSIDALRDFRAALATFRAEAQDALGANDLDIRRAFDWLAEQRQAWQKAVREWQDKVTHAKAELFRRQAVPPGDRVPDCTQQIKALRLAQQRLEEAEQKVAACRRWGPVLERAVDEYRGPARQLSGLVEAELPKAGALLERLLVSLEAYIAVAPGGEPAEAVPPEGRIPNPSPVEEGALEIRPTEELPQSEAAT